MTVGHHEAGRCTLCVTSLGTGRFGPTARLVFGGDGRGRCTRVGRPMRGPRWAETCRTAQKLLSTAAKPDSSQALIRATRPGLCDVQKASGRHPHHPGDCRGHHPELQATSGSDFELQPGDPQSDGFGRASGPATTGWSQPRCTAKPTGRSGPSTGHVLRGASAPLDSNQRNQTQAW